MEKRRQVLSRLLAFGFLLGLMAIPGTEAVTTGEPGGSAFDPSAGCGVQWLADGHYFPALLEAINHARDEIWLSAFLFKTNGLKGNRPDQVLTGLQTAAGRGVAVTVLFEQGATGDQVSQDNRKTATRLRKSGVRVCFDDAGRTTHAKLLVVDGRFLLVGSHNLTQSGLKYNREVSVWIESPALADEALRYLRSICPCLNSRNPVGSMKEGEPK